MPDRVGTTEFPIGSRTIGVLIDAIEQGFTAAEAGTLFFKAGADPWAPEEWPNKATRLQDLFATLRRDGSSDARKATLELVTMTMRAGNPSGPYGRQAQWWEPLKEALASDGWEWDEESQRLTATIPGVEVSREISLLEQGLKELTWSTAAGHFGQAVDSFSRGAWSSSNAQLRAFIEDLLPAIAEAVSGSRPREVQAAIQTLRTQKTLVEGEFNFLRGMWELLQSRGPHPGLSDEEEARYRLMVVTAEARFLLARLANA